MKKITWELPFKTMEYLESLTTLLASNPLIVLIVGIQDSEGVIDSCNIHLIEIDGDMSEVYLHLGALLGSHATAYGFMQEEEATTEEKEEQIKEEQGDETIIEEPQEEEEDLIIEGKDEEEEEKTIEIKVKKTKDISQARKLLRKLLENFKK